MNEAAAKIDSPDPGFLLGSLLKNVSRSFYLTLRVLPRGLRQPVGLAYLLARAADTIADTELVPAQRRLDLLLLMRERINGAPAGAHAAASIAAELSGQQSDPHERTLLNSLAPACALLDATEESDGREIRAVVTTLTQGMELDLRCFPNEKSGELTALSTGAELESYTYLVAGCVGEFWTKMSIAHQPALKGWKADEMCAIGIRFGKALQYTNILRDIPKDLRIGRCYIPSDVLSRHRLQPPDLLDPENSQRARPVLRELVALALGHYREATRYVLEIPVRCPRLRLACLWPILIGLPTLQNLGENERWLDPAHRTKISRGHVKRLLMLSLPSCGSDSLVALWLGRGIDKVRRVFEL